MAGSRAKPPETEDSLQKRPERNRQETSEYIASLLESLRLVAHQAKLPFLAYLIGVALEEANSEKSERD